MQSVVYKMANVISHQGTIESVHGSQVNVRIVQTSACSSCSAKGHCMAAEGKEKIIEITDSNNHYNIGETVEIYGETSMGMKAVFWAFVVPFLVLVISLFIGMAITADELTASACSVGLLILYYILLAMNKHKLKNEFSFKIKSINN